MVDAASSVSGDCVRMVELVARGASVAEIAEALGRSQDEVGGLMRGVEFQRALLAALLDQRAHALHRLLPLRALALDTIEESLRNKDDAPVRLAAASQVVDLIELLSLGLVPRAAARLERSVSDAEQEHGQARAGEREPGSDEDTEPGRNAFHVPRAKGQVWMASAAAVLTALSMAMIGLLAAQMLANRQAPEARPSVAVDARPATRSAHAIEGQRAQQAVTEHGAAATDSARPAAVVAAPAPSRLQAAGSEPASPAHGISAGAMPLSRPNATLPAATPRVMRVRAPRVSRPTQVGPAPAPARVVADPVASSARASLQPKTPGRLGIAMNEAEF